MQRSETTLLYKALCCGAANHSAIPEVKQRSKSVVPPMMRGRRRSVARVRAACSREGCHVRNKQVSEINHNDTRFITIKKSTN